MRTVLFKRTALIGRRALIWCFGCCVNLLIASTAAAQGGQLEIGDTVKVADIPGQLFHVTTDIRNIDDELELVVVVGSVELVNYRIVDKKSPTPEQVKIRESWRKR